MKTVVKFEANGKVSITKPEGTKYVMNYNNFDKKWVFGKEFLNKTSFHMNHNKAVIEVVANDKSKEIIIIDKVAQTATLTSFEELKKIKKQMDAEMLFEYFSDLI